MFDFSSMAGHGTGTNRHGGNGNFIIHARQNSTARTREGTIATDAPEAPTVGRSRYYE